MPVRMASSFSPCASTTKIEVSDPDKNSFSFTQLLMNGDAAAWHGIDPEGAAATATIPSVLPQSDFIVNPPNAAGDEFVIRVPPPAAKDKKRKAAKDLSCITATQPAKAEHVEEKRNSNKRSKSATVKEEGSKANSENTENKKNSKQGKENSKPPPDGKQDYIHVRARRGQATDSHSLAERVRREKISERMKMLQDLVPGCSKVTGKAMMLDEIINYVQSLQRQVMVLSMKLASVKPRLDLYQDDAYLVNEVIAGSQDANGFSDLLHEPSSAQHQQQQQTLAGWQNMTGSQMIASVVENCS